MSSSSTILFEAPAGPDSSGAAHKNVLLPSFDDGDAVPANQHVIVHGKAAMILDPGGHKVYSRVLAETTAQLRGGAQLTGIFLSHQDPDIVAAINGWLMTTDAVAYAPSVWKRFIPHFGLDRLVIDRLKGVPDKGGFIDVGGCKLVALPAHFLHSCGNLHLYDPVSRILYSGDMGASIGVPYLEVPDFDEHVPMIQGFHERYMASNAAMRLWAAMIRTLDVELIAPQHGAFYRGKEMVGRFLDWAEGLSCGVDLLEHGYRVPVE